MSITPVTAARPQIDGIYVISVRRETAEVREQMRAAAYTHVGMAVDAAPGANEQTMLCDPFTSTGFGPVDVSAYIEGLHALAVNPSSIGGEPFRAFDDESGVDSEGRTTDVFMLAMGGRSGVENWAACAEVADEVWPRLLSVLGASVGGVVFEDGHERTLRLDKFTTPKALRLKSGWDLDAEGNQVWLPLEEAWRRFVAHNEERSRRDGEERMDTRTMRRMRRHMEGFYNGHPTTRAAAEAKNTTR